MPKQSKKDSIEKNTCQICGKTPDGHMGLSGYIMITSDHNFISAKDIEKVY